MRKLLVISILAAAMTGAASAQPYYGPGMMGGYGYGGGYGPGYMMGPGYGHGWMMNGYGPGYMMGYGNNGGYRGGDNYRGKRLCWTESDRNDGTGYYAPCRE